MKLRAHLLLLAFLFVGTAVAPAQPRREEELVDKVRKAIEEGKKFLRDQQVVTADGQGHWEIDINSKGRPGGWTSLAILALLTAGEKPDAQVIQRGLKYLRDLEPRDTYVVGLQTMVFVEAGEKQDIARIQRNVDWLVKTAIRNNDKIDGWGYREGGRTSDNSNTQYALLGLWAGKMGGAKVDRPTWEAIRDFYTRSQDQTGGWYYMAAYRSPTLTMSTAGLCGLLISSQELQAANVKFQGGTHVNCGQNPEDPTIAKGTNWIVEHFTIEGQRQHIFYNMYGIERTGRLTGNRFFGEYDWYREGCKYLTRPGSQHDDGSWYLRGQGFDTWPVVSTSFGLLFLSKGRTPVLISKLVHGPEGNPGTDWNNDKNDLRHLTEYASKELFKRQPLAWQVFNPRQTGIGNSDQLVSELLQSPMAYISGHNEPRFNGLERKVLQQYIDQGGFLLVEACCGRRDFDVGFRKLAKELWPENPLVPLKPEHPIWSAHSLVPPVEFRLEGIEMGCKTVVIYIPPQGNERPAPSCLWESNQTTEGRGQLAFRLGANIVAYATGLEMPKPKGFHVEVASEKTETKVPRGYLKIAQIKQSERFRSANHAVRNLMLDLRKNARLDVALQTEELDPDNRDVLNFKLMYMHGKEDFDIKYLDILKANLDTGGILFADACCGKKDFDTAFRRLMGQLYPDKKLEPIPLDDPLYSEQLNGTAIKTVRCRREKADGGAADAEFRSLPPYLEGIKIDNRWAVIYSKYDIGCALEKHQSPDCLGHDHQSALNLASAVVLYALQR